MPPRVDSPKDVWTSRANHPSADVASMNLRGRDSCLAVKTLHRPPSSSENQGVCDLRGMMDCGPAWIVIGCEKLTSLEHSCNRSFNRYWVNVYVIVPSVSRPRSLSGENVDWVAASVAAFRIASSPPSARAQKTFPLLSSLTWTFTV